MEIGKRLIGNSAFLFMDWIVITVLSLVFWIIVGKTMSKEEYGIVATASNIMIILSAVSMLGIQTTVTKMIPELVERRQSGKIKSLIGFSTKICTTVSLIVAVLVAGLSGYLSPLLKLPQEIIVLSAVGIVVFTLWSLTTSMLQGFQTMKKLMKTDLIGNVLKVAVTLAATYMGFSYFGPIVGLIVSIFSIVLFRIDVLLMGMGKKDGKSGLDTKSIITYSVSAFTISVAVIGFANTPNIILNALTTPAVTGLFAVALTITSPILSIPSVLNLALFPITSGLSVSRKNEEVQKKLINMVVRLATFITIPVLFILLMFSDTVILFFSSADFLEARALLPVLGVASFIFGIGSILNTTLYAMKRPMVSRNITILTLAVFVLLSVPLSLTMYAMGMAFAYLASVTVFTGASLLYLRRMIGLRLDMPPLLKVVAAGGVMSLMLFLVDFTLTSTPIKFVAAVLSLMVYVIVLGPLRFYKSEDLNVIRTLSQKAPVGRSAFALIEKFVSRWV